MSMPRVIAGLALLAGGAMLVWPEAGGMPAAARHAAALAIAVIGLWATGVVPEYLTALLFFLGANLLAVAPQTAIFSGFTSGALWLAFAGLVIAAAMRSTGLAARVARTIAARTPSSYPALVGAVVLIGTLFAFAIPSSMGRVSVFVPIVAALVDHLGYAPGSKGRVGLLIAACVSAILPGFAVLPANVPNLVMIGASEAVLGITPRYADYLLLHFPVIGALKSVAIAALVVALFRESRKPLRPAAPAEPMSPGEKRLAVVLAVTLLLWLGDAWHGISPAWVGLGAALACVLPGLRLVPLGTVREGGMLDPLLYVAGVMGVGAVINASGLGTILGAWLLDLTDLAPGEDGRSFAVLALSSTALSLATTATGLPAVYTALVPDVAAASGLSQYAVLMTEVLAFSTVILPYQVAPFVVALQIAGVRTVDAARLTLALTAVTVVALLPLSYLWWRWLGYLG